VSISSFFAPDAAARVRDAVAAVERQSSAEIVVALRHSSGHYRHVDYLVGVGVSLLLLCLFLYHPEPFDFTLLPLELLGGFAVGAVASAQLPPLRRLLTARKVLDRNVHDAARALFVDQKITRTTGRTGVLVYLSMLERQVEIVADLGVEDEVLGAPWKAARATLERTLAEDPSLDRLIANLRALGPALAEKLPRAADDVNELSDEVIS
jgi:putative membrane protein